MVAAWSTKTFDNEWAFRVFSLITKIKWQNNNRLA
jgi:hypothetical protein